MAQFNFQATASLFKARKEKEIMFVGIHYVPEILLNFLIYLSPLNP
jgi:hypothetical protein